MKIFNVMVTGVDDAFNHIHLFAETDDFDYDALKIYVAADTATEHKVQGAVEYVNKDHLYLVFDPDGNKFREDMNNKSGRKLEPDELGAFEFVSERDI